MLSSFRDQVQWEKYWKDTGCIADGGKEKFICKAFQLCMQEVIPEFLPVSVDDCWIQILLVIIMILIIDRIDLEVKLKRD